VGRTERVQRDGESQRDLRHDQGDEAARGLPVVPRQPERPVPGLQGPRDDRVVCLGTRAEGTAEGQEVA